MSANRVLYSVRFFDGINWVTRYAMSVTEGEKYMVFDRYDDGDEFLITRGFRDHVQNTFNFEDTVMLLDSVIQ